MPKSNKKAKGEMGAIPAVVTVAELAARGQNPFKITLESGELASMAQQLDVTSIAKFSFQGTITALGREGWKVVGNVGATATQPCSVTLEPVKTRIDETVERRFVPEVDQDLPSQDSVIEMDDDVDTDVLGDQIDLLAIASEVIALNLPAFPRAPDATLTQAVFTAPGIEPLTDEDVKPFAALAGLKDKLTKPTE